jgi:hypothetical protein
VVRVPVDCCTIWVGLFDLPQDVRPSGEVELAIEFAAPWKLDPHSRAEAVARY